MKYSENEIRETFQKSFDIISQKIENHEYDTVEEFCMMVDRMISLSRYV